MRASRRVKGRDERPGMEGWSERRERQEVSRRQPRTARENGSDEERGDDSYRSLISHINDGGSVYV